MKPEPPPWVAQAERYSTTLKGVRFEKADPQQQRINLSILSPTEKRRVWGLLQAQHPEFAAWLSSAPVRAMLAEFDAQVLIDPAAISDPSES